MTNMGTHPFSTQQARQLFVGYANDPEQVQSGLCSGKHFLVAGGLRWKGSRSPAGSRAGETLTDD